MFGCAVAGHPVSKDTGCQGAGCRDIKKRRCISVAFLGFTLRVARHSKKKIKHYDNMYYYSVFWFLSF